MKPLSFMPRLLVGAGVALFGALTILPFRAQGQAPEYSVTVLGAIPNGTYVDGDVSIAYGINASGQVSGYFTDTEVGVPVVWTGTTPTILAGLSSFGGTPIATNASGQVAGASPTADGGPIHAVVWNGTTPTDLGTLGGTNSTANGINDSGQVVGYSDLTDGEYSVVHAVKWNGTTPTDLGTLPGFGPGADSTAYGINNSGQVVGYSSNADGYNHATVWNGTTPTDLGTPYVPLGINPSIATSYGMSINASGQVAGSSGEPGLNETHAILWTGATGQGLGTLGGPSSEASGINDQGEVVGMADTSNQNGNGDYIANPFLYTNGTIYDLDSLLMAGSDVTSLWFGNGSSSNNGPSGNAINDSGQIAATADIGGQTEAVLLTPVTVPEPGSAVLLLGGATLLGLRGKWGSVFAENWQRSNLRYCYTPHGCRSRPTRWYRRKPARLPGSGPQTRTENLVPLPPLSRLKDSEG
jgi:probable HAF family extracellular repeat protein